jgi:hypothetical protein
MLNIFDLYKNDKDPLPYSLASVLEDIEKVKHHAVLALEYARKHKRPIPELEQIISTDADMSFFYAKEILNGKRFKLGEKEIAKQTDIACRYAIQIIKGKWAAGEEAIAKDSFYAKLYTKKALKKSFILNGKTILDYADINH